MSDDLKFGTDNRTLFARLERLTTRAKGWLAAGWRGMRVQTRITLLAVAVIALAGFESQNMRAGAERLFLDRPDWQIMVGAIGLMLAFLVAERLACERKRADTADADLWSAASWTAFGCCLFLVFSNVSGEAMTAGDKAGRSATELENLQADLAAARVKLQTAPEPIGLDAEREILKARIAEASGWGMDDLNADGSCLNDLKHRQRQLCNEAAELRERILRGEAMLAALADKRAEVDRLATLIAHWEDDESVAHWKAMAMLTGDRLDWRQIASWGLFLLSGALIWLTGKLNDYLFEELEKV